MKNIKLEETNESVYGKSIRVSPIMIPEKKFYRVDQNGAPFWMSFSEKKVIDTYWKFYDSGEMKNTKGTHMLIDDEMLGFPKGSWLCIEEVDEGYAIEANVNELEFTITRF